ncbi:hypothetical protein ACJIZ3_009693 [Penstemon smallii]|uniref:AT-hook motif nuclear-localized protein n=1 Tax=Penstemon smallii TaxID=265156 RepID=A0ABD3TDS0_9LAMI
MDSQDSSAHPPHHHHHHQQQHHHHHHHQQQPPHAVLMNQHTQQHQFPNNNNSNSNNSMMHQQQQNTRFPFNSMAAKPLDHNNYADSSSIDPARKKRGRPRKYSPDHNAIGLGLSPATPAAQISSSIVVHHNDSGGGGGTHSSEAQGKKNRGRPPSSVKKQLDALGCPGVGFTPHVITVDTGEDIASRIMAFSQQGPRTVCILSANGAIRNVTLRQPATSGGTVTYEGRFEIISLSGSFQLSESNGNLSRTGGLSVSLAGSDGRVLGGGVAGMLQAASTVQIIVGSFIADGKKPKNSSKPSSTPPPSHMLNFGAQGTGATPSPDESSDSGEDNDDSPGSGPYSNANAGQPIQNMNIYSTMGWPNSMKMPPN